MHYSELPSHSGGFPASLFHLFLLFILHMDTWEKLKTHNVFPGTQGKVELQQPLCAAGFKLIGGCGVWFCAFLDFI